MKAHNNDNKDPFETLGAATLRVLEKLVEKNEDGAGNSAQVKTDEEQTKDHGEYIERRVSEIAQFEKRASGLVPHRSPRPSRR